MIKQVKYCGVVVIFDAKLHRNDYFYACNVKNIFLFFDNFP